MIIVCMLWNPAPCITGKGFSSASLPLLRYPQKAWYLPSGVWDPCMTGDWHNSNWLQTQKSACFSVMAKGERGQQWEQVYFVCMTFLWAIWIPQKLTKLKPLRNVLASVGSLANQGNPEERSLACTPVRLMGEPKNSVAQKSEMNGVWQRNMTYVQQSLSLLIPRMGLGNGMWVAGWRVATHLIPSFPLVYFQGSPLKEVSSFNSKFVILMILDSHRFFYCYLTNYHKYSGLEQHTFVT